MKKILKLESTIERSCVNHAQLFGYNAIKIIKRGWPDRLFNLENGYCFYVEFKRVGKKAEALQEYTHNRIREDKTHVYVCDNLSRFKAILIHEEIIAKSINNYSEYLK